MGKKIMDAGRKQKNRVYYVQEGKRMKKRKIFVMASVLVITATALSGVSAGTVYAVEGWNNEGEKWKYLDEGNRPEKNVWRQAKDSMFYLGDDGVMLKNCFVEWGTGLYHVDERGARAENAWFFNPEDDGQGHGSGWYYFGTNGKAYRRTDSSYKRNVDGKAYIFNQDGLMLTGWFNEAGEALGEDENPLADGLYYADEDGELKTNAWLDYAKTAVDGLGGLTSDSSGRDYSGYDQIWLYFNGHSRKLKGEDGRLMQKNINGNTYGFDEYGVMLPWWSKVASVSNADKSTATSNVPAKFFAGYDGGKLLKDAWFWMYPSENLAADASDGGEYSWWHTDQNGGVYRNKIKQINNRYYAFDGLGRMQTGFVLFDNRSIFVAQYDSDAWSAEDFIKGNVYGNEKGDLYFFDPDELNDGSMQTGREVKIELEDGVHTFGFSRKGVAYGNRNRLQRVKDSFYLNGLRLDASDEYGYGVVQEGEDSYRVVDASGKMISGHEKVVRDKDGAWLLIHNGQFSGRVYDEYKPRWHDGSQGSGFYHYDPKNKEDKYAGGLIEISTSSIPDEETLNFDF